MKIRLEGTEPELKRAKQFYESLQSQGMIKLNQWSKPYPNRKSPGFRVYIELEILNHRPLKTQDGGYIIRRKNMNRHNIELISFLVVKKS